MSALPATRTVVVTTPAAVTGLTTVDVVKTEIGITDTTEDEFLQTQIDRASVMICGYLGVVAANDGSVTLGRETLLETIYAERCDRVLRLSRSPVVTVTSVVEGDDTIDATDYLVGTNAGALTRLNCSYWRASAEHTLVIAYTGGWLLPGESGRNLPLDIEYAAIALVKAARFGRARDPALRSEDILSGLYGYTLFDSSDKAGGFPPFVANLLDRYRQYR